MFAKVVTFAAVAAHSALALSMGYPLCITQPALTLEAGKSSLSAIVHSPMERRCEATLHFSDPSFLPLRYSFGKLECDGSQVLALTVPKGSPNGDVDIIWQCTGLAPTCNHGIISGGTADLSIASESTGNVGCLVETVETRTSPVTVTRSSGTFVTMEPTVVVTTTTSFARRTNSWTTLRTSFEGSGTESQDPEPTTGTPTSSDGLHSDTTTFTEETSRDATSDNTVLETITVTTMPIPSATLDLDVPQEAAQTTLGASDDGVFISDASKIPISIMPAIATTVISTLTVFRTVTARCTS